jgi:hypothetical protein
MGYAKFTWTPAGGSLTSYTLAANYSFATKPFLQDASDHSRAIDGTLRTYSVPLKESWLLSLKNISLEQRDQLKTIKEAQVDINFYKNSYPAGQIKTITMANGGSGYHVNDILTIVQGGAQLGTIKVLTVNGSGTILTWSLLTYGTGYSVANDLATTVLPVGGSGATFNITAIEIDEITFIARWVNAFNFTETAPGIWAGTIQLEEI